MNAAMDRCYNCDTVIADGDVRVHDVGVDNHRPFCKYCSAELRYRGPFDGPAFGGPMDKRR